jgi:hypothetical protein
MGFAMADLVGCTGNFEGELRWQPETSTFRYMPNEGVTGSTVSVQFLSEPVFEVDPCPNGLGGQVSRSGNVTPDCRHYIETSVVVRMATEDGSLNEDPAGKLTARSITDCKLQAHIATLVGRFQLVERPQGELFFSIDASPSRDGLSGLFSAVVGTRSTGDKTYSAMQTGVVAGEWSLKHPVTER